MRRLAALAFALPLVLTAACPSREVAQIQPTQEKTEYKDIPVQLNRNVDLLFLIDDSGSMAEEQVSLANNFPDFINVLNTIEGGLPNVHIGVISPNVGIGGYAGVQNCEGEGDGGRLQSAPHGGCTAGPGPEPYIIDVEDEGSGTRIKNYSGDLAAMFGCIAQLGASGCGFEQQLEAIYKALNNNPYNGGFIRDDAYLAVVIISDEDDCSAQDPYVFNPSTDPGTINQLGPLDSFRCSEFGVTCAEGNIGRNPASYTNCRPRTDSYLRDPKFYADFLKSVKADPNMVLVAGVFGQPTPVVVGTDEKGEPKLMPSCGEDRMQPADPGVRFTNFIEQFPNRFTYKSICDPDLSDALIMIAELLKRVIGDPCIQGTLTMDDIYPERPGLQIDCQVSDVYMPGTDAETQTPLPRCDMTSETQVAPGSPSPCWFVYANMDDCAETPTHLALEVYPETREAPAGTHVVARCRLE